MSPPSLPPYQPSYDSDEADGITGAGAAPPTPELEREHDDVAPNVCADCGKQCASARGLAIHHARIHASKNGPPATNGKAAPTRRSGRPKVARTDVGDQLRELVALFDRLAEARDEVARLEHEAGERQAELAKAWSR